MKPRRETRGKRWFTLNSPFKVAGTERLLDADHLIEFKESLQKGGGVFAKANIPRGTRIISEQALLEFDLETVTLKNIVPASNVFRLPSKNRTCSSMNMKATYSRSPSGMK